MKWLIGLGMAMSSVVGFGAASAEKNEWPPLPTSRYISGRPATIQDVKDGNAVFVASVKKLIIGRPLSIPIPQYAYWMNKTGQQVRVIVVQAEEAMGMQIFGVRDTHGKTITCTGAELTLLGTGLPN